MSGIPTLQTERLILRPFTLADAPRVQLLAGVREVADTALSIPHPYSDGVAEQWISGHAGDFEKGDSMSLAVCLKDGSLIGAAGLMNFRTEHKRGEIGYWIGKDYWGLGYCTEAVGEVVRCGFEQLGLNRIYGHHFSRNVASGRVMGKTGMKHEGCLRQHYIHQGKFEDIEYWGLLKGEWEGQTL